MLGCVHGGQPTVISECVSSVKRVNAWICVLLTSDRDPAIVSAQLEEKICNDCLYYRTYGFLKPTSPVTMFL